MRVSLQRSELSRLLAAVTKVVDTKNTIPLLSHVLLVVDGETADIRATDLDIEASAWVAVQGYETDDDSTTSHQFAVPGRDFADIVRRLAADTVQLELDGQWLWIKGGRSKFKLPTLLGDDFPSLSTPDPESGVEFTADLAALTKRVSWAVGPHDTYALEGVFLHSNGTLTAVATDARRLVRADGPDAPQFDGVILPTKLLANLPAGEVDVLIGDDKIAIRQGALVMVSKLIAGTYPDYRKLWPVDQAYSMHVGRQEMKAAVERVAALSDEDRGRGVLLSVVPGQVVLSVESHTRGLAEEEVPVDYNGEPYDVGFNVAFLSEMLGAVPGDRLEIQLGGRRGANFNGAPGFAGCLMYFELGRAA